MDFRRITLFSDKATGLNTNTVIPLRIERWFYFFLCAHLLLWTIVPAVTRLNLPLDAIEGTIWSHQLQWGYDKNPFLNGWLTALATSLDGQSGWMIYLFSQLSVMACFISVWLLAKKMLPLGYALIAVLILEAVQYYNFHAIDFNDNTLELGLWGLTIYFFYQALQTRSRLAWLLTGSFAGFGMMAKYYTAALLTAMLLFLLSDANYRKQLMTAAPYVGLGAFLLILLPHMIWLFFHEFITITYVFARTSTEPSWINHFFFPAQFTWQQLQVFLPAIALTTFLFIGKKSPTATPPFQLTAFNRRFLMVVGLGPFLLTILLSLVLGIKLRAGWGMPLLSLFGIILVALLKPQLTTTKLKCFLASIFLLMILSAGIYSASIIDSRDMSSANFPGRSIANTLTQNWHDHYHTPLRYVAGSRWVGGNIGFYSPDHPTVFIEWDKRRAPWINILALKKQGAIFIWNISENETLPAAIQQQFPKLQKATVMEFAWQRNKHHLAPTKLGVAILPPESSSL